MDRQLKAGERWSPKLERVIRNSHFFLACLSKAAIAKKGIIVREREIALDIASIFPDRVPYLLPVFLEECELPSTSPLCSFQWVNLFQANGFESLCQALEQGIQGRLPQRDDPDRSILVHGVIAFPVYPVVSANVVTRLFTGNAETFVHPRIREKLQADLKGYRLPPNTETLYYNGEHHFRYDLEFVLPGEHQFSTDEGFVVPEVWPPEFAGEDVRLGKNITEQFVLTFKKDGSLSVSRRKRHG